MGGLIVTAQEPRQSWTRAVPRSLLASLAILAVAAVAAACGGQTAPEGSGAAPAASSLAPVATGVTACAGDAPAGDVAAAGALIDAANLADAATITLIQAIRFTPAGTLAACRHLAAGVTGDALWAAAWVYGTGGTDPDPLLALLGSDDPTIRAIAGAGLASLGRVEGLDALAGLVSVDAGLRGSLPPVSVSAFSAATLADVTNGAVGDVSTSTPEERTDSAAAWRSWLDGTRSRLSFDADQRLWLAR